MSFHFMLADYDIYFAQYVITTKIETMHFINFRYKRPF